MVFALCLQKRHVSKSMECAVFKKFCCFPPKVGDKQVRKNSEYTFESRIHVYRAIRRMSQKELADLVGVSRQTIVQLERNHGNPSMLLAFCIAKAFDVTIEDIFDFMKK